MKTFRLVCLTFIRNYPEFFENDYNNVMTLAKQHIDEQWTNDTLLSLIMRIQC